jgi:hypothetical protein
LRELCGAGGQVSGFSLVLPVEVAIFEGFQDKGSGRSLFSG